MNLLSFAFDEARASLVRGGRGAIMSIGTIAIAFLALGGFLLVTTNLQQFVRQWMESAELSVFLRDDIIETEREAVRARLAGDAGVLSVDYVSKDAALDRFRSDFPELADVSDTINRYGCPSAVNRRIPGTTPTVEIVIAFPLIAIPHGSEKIRAARITRS